MRVCVFGRVGRDIFFSGHTPCSKEPARRVSWSSKAGQWGWRALEQSFLSFPGQAAGIFSNDCFLGVGSPGLPEDPSGVWLAEPERGSCSHIPSPPLPPWLFSSTSPQQCHPLSGNAFPSVTPGGLRRRAKHLFLPWG